MEALRWDTTSRRRRRRGGRSAHLSEPAGRGWASAGGDRAARLTSPPAVLPCWNVAGSAYSPAGILMDRSRPRARSLDDAHSSVVSRKAARDATPTRGLCDRRRLRDHGAGRPRRLHRLVVLPALRLSGGLRRAPRDSRARAVAARSRRGRARRTPPLSGRHAGPRDRVRDGLGGGHHRRLHAAA
jgi:hypothetical protein